MDGFDGRERKHARSTTSVAGARTATIRRWTAHSSHTRGIPSTPHGMVRDRGWSSDPSEPWGDLEETGETD
jgi:hypothetical protein